jgi:thiol-disulfide isomerase/thioredoxin
MRLEQKYFIPFIGICAALTLIVIVYGTINYSKNQNLDFRDSIAAVDIDTLSFEQYYDTEKLLLENLKGDPVVIQFWSTWSGRSKSVNQFLDSYQRQNPELKVIAAVVRDGDEQIQQYANQNEFNFIYTKGTDFFYELLVPGVPSQILIQRDGRLFDTQVGDDIETLEKLLNQLLRDG